MAMPDLHRCPCNLKESVREKLKGAYGEKLSIGIATNLTSICCVNKEKIVKNDSTQRT